MIVRERPGSYFLIKQHDHGLISGEFARRWAEQPRPRAPTLYAIANHDAGWQALDASVRWNQTSGRPYSFADYPVEPKLRAYREALDLLEAQKPYAACLCSMHYTTLASNSEDGAVVRFRKAEAGRQRRIKDEMTEEELANLGHNLRLLRLCDNLSLFVCLNEPGRNDHPWYRSGFEFEGSTFVPLWENEYTLLLDPNPFCEPFDLAVPYVLVDKDGRDIESNRLQLRVTC